MMMKKSLLMLAAAAILAGCRSDLYYQNRAVDRARNFLLEEKAGELSVDEMNFVRFNQPAFSSSRKFLARSTARF